MKDKSFDRWEISKELRQNTIPVVKEFHKQPTKSVAILWDALCGKKLAGIKFRRQQPIGPFAVDFYVPSHRLIIEVDEPIHANQADAVRGRKDLLESLGFRFIRVNAYDVKYNFDQVLSALRSAFAMK
ncbi:MAG: DUF559 domain-containing protein [Chloroflexi bacterium]|nr:DUF559 domain-containing protein [Chloroflexota bacterium]